MSRIATSVYYVECMLYQYVWFSKEELGDCDIFCDSESFWSFWIIVIAEIMIGENIQLSENAFVILNIWFIISDKDLFW